MTEAEWLVAVNCQKMLPVVRSKGSERLWRLFAVACCRRVEHLMRDDRSRKALDVAEAFADGEATAANLKAARSLADAAAHQAHVELYDDEVRANFAWDAGYNEVFVAMGAADAGLQCVAENIGPNINGEITVISESLQLPDLLRDIFGNPFRITSIDPSWLAINNGTVPKIAQTIYDDRAFDHMPILADALEDAGCNDTDILRHCREPAEHVRGCWVIDLLLGKE